MFKFCKCVSFSLAVACCTLVNVRKIILDTFFGRLLISTFISVTFFLLYFHHSVNCFHLVRRVSDNLKKKKLKNE